MPSVIFSHTRNAKRTCSLWNLFALELVRFGTCLDAGCRYLLRFKEDGIPCISEEYRELRKLEGSYQEEKYLIPEKKKGKG